MAASVLIIIVSGFFGLYWFRYVCVLILNTTAQRDYTGEVAAENGLSFLHLPVELTDMRSGGLDRVAQSLQRDYEQVRSLLKQATQLGFGRITFEQRILRIDFLLMSTWYSVSSRLSPTRARRTAGEMRQIVFHLTNSYGELVAGIRD